MAILAKVHIAPVLDLTPPEAFFTAPVDWKVRYVLVTPQVENIELDIQADDECDVAEKVYYFGQNEHAPVEEYNITRSISVGDIITFDYNGKNHMMTVEPVYFGNIDMKCCREWIIRERTSVNVKTDATHYNTQFGFFKLVPIGSKYMWYDVDEKVHSKLYDTFNQADNALEQYLWELYDYNKAVVSYTEFNKEFPANYKEMIFSKYLV